MATIGYWICLPFAALLRLFYSMTGSYGVSLILFTLVIKLVLLPLQMKSKKSMVRMNRMSGKMQEIQKKYANNQMRMQEEMQKLYAEQGVNPMSGCMWSFLPLPILMALYYIIQQPIVYFMNFGSRANGEAVMAAATKVVEKLGHVLPTLDNGKLSPFAQIEAVKHIVANQDAAVVQEFIAANPNWINVDYSFIGLDLSVIPTAAFEMLKTGVTWAAIGLVILPLISVVFQVLMMKSTMSGQNMEGQAAATNKMMLWMMPLMSLWIGFTLPAALAVYWAAQAAFSAIQEYLLGKFYNGKLEEEENERQRLIEEDRKKRQEEGRKQQERQRQQAAQQQKLTLKEKRQAAQEAKEAKKAKSSTSEAGRVGDRPYARGRSYRADRYDD